MTITHKALSAELTDSEQPASPIEEHYYRRGDIDFCFMMNRVHHNLRVFDYRVGNYQQKRDFFDRIARAEGLKKVFTVVEKQDSKSWRSVGFSREGAIPGYFRTADAYVMSRVYTDEGDPIQGGAPKLNALPVTPLTGDVPEKPRSMSVELVNDPERLQKIAAQAAGPALYAPFRRQYYRPDLALRGKIGKRQYWVGGELDTSFGHVKIDLMTPPQKETDVPILVYCLNTLLEELKVQSMASVFSMVAADNPMVGQVYASLNFKVTAKLTDHYHHEKEGFKGIQMWHRRIAQANSPRLQSFI